MGLIVAHREREGRLNSKIQYYVHSEADRRLNCREVSAICVTEVQGVTECQSGGQCSDGKLYFCWMSSLNSRAVMPTKKWYLPNDKCNSLARKFKDSITNYVKTNIFFYIKSVLIICKTELSLIMEWKFVVWRTGLILLSPQPMCPNLLMSAACT